MSKDNLDINEFPSDTYRVETACGRFYTTIMYDRERKHITNVFFHAGKAGSCVQTQLATLARFFERLPIESAMEAVAGMSGTVCANAPYGDNCVSAIAYCLMNVLINMRSE